MGAVAGFAVLPADRWQSALSEIAAAGVEVCDEGKDRGLQWYRCVRGACSIGLGFGVVVPPGSEVGVCVYSPARRWWRRPVGMWRLSRDVWRAVQHAGGVRA